jgi:hypothetical protein
MQGVIAISDVGPQGPPGPQGPEGPEGDSLINFVNITGSRDLALTDGGKMLIYSGTSNITLTVLTNAAVPFIIGTEIDLIHTAVSGLSGALLVGFASGVTSIAARVASGFGTIEANGVEYRRIGKLIKIDTNS